MKKNGLKKFLSVKFATRPDRFILGTIIVFNMFFMVICALVIRALNVSGTEKMGFFEALFYSMRVIMSNNIDFSLEESGNMEALAVVCIIGMLVGMVLFTGSLIAYLTNTIAKVIDHKSPYSKKLALYGHIVILGWNVRGPEIIRNLLYARKRFEVLILSAVDREKVLEEIEESTSDAIRTYNENLKERLKKENVIKRRAVYRLKKLRNRLSIIVRKGETYSTEQLIGTSLSMASSVIILGEDVNNLVAEDMNGTKYDTEFGNAQILKTVAQVVEVTASEKSANGQNVIVEIDDDWTLQLVGKIIRDKEVAEKCSVIPMPVTRTIGNLIAQFALTPELGRLYSYMFSFSKLNVNIEETDGEDYAERFLRENVRAFPLSFLELPDRKVGLYVGRKDEQKGNYTVEDKIALNGSPKRVFNDAIFFGYNAKLELTLDSINRIVGSVGEKANVMIVDRSRRIVGTEGLSHCNITEAYIKELGAAETFMLVAEFVKNTEKNITFVLLSDDTVDVSRLDDEMFATLIRTREMIKGLEQTVEGFDSNRISVVTEILNPKHYDVVKSYGVDNVIISNRYTSRMVTQFAFKSSLFEFYKRMGSSFSAFGMNSGGADVNVFYAGDILKDVPKGEVTAFSLIRQIFNASKRSGNPLVLVGVINEEGKLLVFKGDQRDIKLKISEKTKLVFFKQ